MKDRIGILLISASVVVAFIACRYATAHAKVVSGGVYFTPGPECENHIVNEINRARKIDIAVYSITNKKIADSIFSAHKRGARIRIITDRTMSGGKYSLATDLSTAGIPLRRNRKHKIEHNKFAVFDGMRIVTGSYNWTRNATQYNSENCIFLNMFGPEYSMRFEYLWNLYGD